MGVGQPKLTGVFLPSSIFQFTASKSFLVFLRYHNDGIFIIDVSQSVEHDHPHALEFLRKDCTNISGIGFEY